MAFSLRLSRPLEASLEHAAALAGISKSEFVRRCLEEQLAKQELRPTAYELGKDLFGKYGSGRGDLARNAKKIVKEIIRAKAARRRHRTAGRAV